MKDDRLTEALDFRGMKSGQRMIHSESGERSVRKSWCSQFPSDFVQLNPAECRFPPADKGTAINEPRLATLHLMDENLANCGPRSDSNGNFANVGEFEREAASETRMNSCRCRDD